MVRPQPCKWYVLQLRLKDPSISFWHLVIRMVYWIELLTYTWVNLVPWIENLSWLRVAPRSWGRTFSISGDSHVKSHATLKWRLRKDRLRGIEIQHSPFLCPCTPLNQDYARNDNAQCKRGEMSPVVESLVADLAKPLCGTLWQSTWSGAFAKCSHLQVFSHMFLINSSSMLCIRCVEQ